MASELTDHALAELAAPVYCSAEIVAHELELCRGSMPWRADIIARLYDLGIASPHDPVGAGRYDDYRGRARDDLNAIREQIGKVTEAAERVPTAGAEVQAKLPREVWMGLREQVIEHAELADNVLTRLATPSHWMNEFRDPDMNRSERALIELASEIRQWGTKGRNFVLGYVPVGSFIDLRTCPNCLPAVKCERCGGPREYRYASIWCHQCLHYRGTVAGLSMWDLAKTWFDRPSDEDRRVRHLACTQFEHAEFSQATIDRLVDWLVSSGATTVEAFEMPLEEVTKRMTTSQTHATRSTPPLSAAKSIDWAIPSDWDGTVDGWPAAKLYGYVVDHVILGPTPAWGNSFPISNFDCKAVPGDKPSICPNADRKPQPEWLPQIEKRFRDLRLVGEGQTIHWVGSQSKAGNVCGCYFPAVAIELISTAGNAGNESRSVGIQTVKATDSIDLEKEIAGKGGRTVRHEEHEGRKRVAERWELFCGSYKSLGYKRCSWEFFANWAIDTFEDMPSDDPAELRRMVDAYRKTPFPRTTV